MRYKVRYMLDDDYEVIELTPSGDQPDENDTEAKFDEQSVYQGRLADCEAYIRLHEGGYM